MKLFVNSDHPQLCHNRFPMDGVLLAIYSSMDDVLLAIYSSMDDVLLAIYSSTLL